MPDMSTFASIFEAQTPAGVWAFVVRDDTESIDSVYATEIEALRVAVAHGYGRVTFLPYGKTLANLEEA